MGGVSGENDVTTESLLFGLFKVDEVGGQDGCVVGDQQGCYGTGGTSELTDIAAILWLRDDDAIEFLVTESLTQFLQSLSYCQTVPLSSATIARKAAI